MMKYLSTCLAIFMFVMGVTSLASAEIKIGINAPRGESKAIKKWGEFGTYLEKELGDKVVLVPKKVSTLLKLMGQGELDFILANPVQTIIMSHEHGTIPLATMNKKNGPQFAGVIIAKKGSGITTAADLKGKKVMSLSPAAAGAYVFQTYYLVQQGIDPRTDCAAFIQGKKLDDLVLAVRAGVMDAAFIKTGILEAMTKEGKITNDDFVVVDERQDPGFTQRHTTPLYPAWYFSATKNTSADLRTKAKAAILKLTADNPASKNAKITGFVEALPLDELNTALQTLKLRPYN